LVFIVVLTHWSCFHYSISEQANVPTTAVLTAPYSKNLNLKPHIMRYNHNTQRREAMPHLKWPWWKMSEW